MKALLKYRELWLLAGIVVLAWIYILRGAGMDTAMNMAMGDVMMPMPWTFATFRVMLVMWIVMMTAMMLRARHR